MKVTSKIMRYCGTPLEGKGKTWEEAKKDLKNKIIAYKNAMKEGTYLQETGETSRSPGMVAVKSDGRIALTHNEDRKVKILARPRK